MTATFEAPSHPDELPPLHASSLDQQCWPPMPAFSLNTHVTQVLDAQHAAPHISADVKLLPVKPLHAMPLIGNFKGPVPLQCGEGGLIGTLDAPCPGKGPLPTHGMSPIQQPLALEYTHVTQARSATWQHCSSQAAALVAAGLAERPRHCTPLVGCGKVALPQASTAGPAYASASDNANVMLQQL